jgi:hypothetical protein
MSKSEIRGKHDEDATQLRRRSQPVPHPYKEGPLDRVNGGTTEDARADKDKDPRVSQHAKDKDKRLTGGVGRLVGSAKPGLNPVQVHFREE